MSDVPLLVDTNAAAVAVRRPTSTIRRWAHEGRLVAYGRDRKGRKLYDLAVVQEVARELEAGARPGLVPAPRFKDLPLF